MGGPEAVAMLGTTTVENDPLLPFRQEYARPPRLA